MTSLHERMMQSHNASGNQKGMPKDISSYDIVLKSKRQIAEGTYEFTFTKPANFDYKAGQHGRMTLIDPPETDHEGNARFLSFASTPSEPDLTFAMRMRDTAFKRVLSHLQPGTKVLWQMRKNTPHGSFTLQNASEASKPAVFLIGGIGIVPVFSMIKDALQHEVNHKITLIYSNRRSEDAPYLTELQHLTNQHSSQFQFVPTMTEPEKSIQSWSGETGRISAEMIREYVPNLQTPLYYIAGLTEMVNAMQKLLADAGVNKDKIRAEEFGAFTMAHEGERATSKSKWASALIVAFIVIMISAHVVGASALVKAGHSKTHVEILVAVFGLLCMVVIVFVKIKLVQRHLKARAN